MEILEAPLAEWGILALGWLILIPVTRRLWTLQDKMLELVENNTKFMTLQEERSRMLSKVKGQ